MLCSQIAGETGEFARAAALAKHLGRRGHEVTVVAASTTRHVGGRHVLREGVSCWEAGGLGPRKLRQTGVDPTEIATRLLVSDRAFDVVHAFSPRPTAAWHAARLRRSGVPLVYDWADLLGFGGFASQRRGVIGYVIGLIDTRLEEAIVTSADSVTAISTFLARRALRLRAPRGGVWLLPPGADSEAIFPVDQRAARRALGIPQGCLLVGFAGFHRLDVDLLAAVLARLSPRYPALRLAVAGPSGAFLQRQLDPRWRDRLIRFPSLSGERYRNFLGCADVLLLPYPGRRYNLARYPHKIGEYLASGRAIVTNPTGDMGALLARHSAALLVEETAAGLAEGVARCLEDERLRQELGRRARALAETEFRWERVAARLEEAYIATAAASGQRPVSVEKGW
ncbi:MAG: glycosyltransferase [Chloroflexota bacterium]|nr:glycosyltransferase [Dehalococcoidia bacterium]MDW8254196.1 glycosyltransferase [Chloroflexota bacterium]